MLIVIGRVKCAAQHRAELVAAFERMQDASRREDGCLRYGFFAAVEDPLQFIAVEEWADRKALDRHFAQPHLREFAGRLAELASEAPEVAIHEIAETQPFPGRPGGSTSDGNEIVRATDAWSRGDFDGVIENWADDAVLDWSRSHGLDAGVYRGKDEIRAFFERLVEPFSELRAELLEDPTEVATGVWVVENVVYVRGRDGIEAQAKSTWLIRFRDGRQASLTLFQTRAEAVEAAARA
jgi:quinol monooxygenase YgiN/ketosteroid isomerase-like protein